jgi:transposase
MEQRAVMRFVTLKGLSLKDIHPRFESVYMDQALCLRTVYKWHERFMQRRTKLFDDPRSGQSLQNDLANTLRAMIREFSFTLCKRLCTHFRLAKSTCLRILHDVLRLKKFNLRWVRHSLDGAQKVERVSLSTDLVRVLKEDQNNGFTQVITGDESWFDFDYLHQLVWIPSRDEISERIK